MVTKTRAATALLIAVRVVATMGLALPAFAAEVTPGTSKALTNLIASTLAEDRRLDVLAATDVQDVLRFEADKQLMGCDASGSCLAEIAGAMGARFVVFGHLDRLGELMLLTLNLFDSSKTSSVSRVTVQARTLEEFAEKIEPAVQKLLFAVELPVPAPAKTAARARVLVLDVKTGAQARKPSEPTSPPDGALNTGADAPLNAWLLGAGAAMSTGAVAAVIGGVLHGLAWQSYDTAKASSTRQPDVAAVMKDGQAQQLGAIVLYGSAALLAAGGVGLGALAGVPEENAP